MFICSYLHEYELRLSLNLLLSICLWEGYPDSVSYPLQVRIKAGFDPVKLPWGVKISNSIKFKALGMENGFGRWKTVIKREEIALVSLRN